MSIKTHTFFTSDLHLGHAPIIGFCERPYVDVVEMDEDLIQRFNSRVKMSDTVYFLGDLCFHPAKVGVPLLSRLNGAQKILVQGNHDKYSAAQYRDAGFTIVQEAVIQYAGFRVRLSHYPYSPVDTQEDADAHYARYLELRPKIDPKEVLLCGHVHEKWKVKKSEPGAARRWRMINVGVDVWDFYPASGSQIEKMLNDPG